MIETTYTIIVTYNGEKWIKDCINSVLNVSTVVIVDNNSIDRTIEIILNEFPNVVIFRNKDNLGFGKANNIGITYAIKKNAKHVLLLNQDAKLADNTLESMIEFSENNTNYGIISPIHCDWSGKYLENSFERYMSYKYNEDFLSDYILNKKKLEVYDVPFVAAACWLIPTHVFKIIGGFDPIFFHLGEDNNFTQRLRFYNFKIGVLPNSFVFHDTKDRIYNALIKYSEEYYYRTGYRRKVLFADVNYNNQLQKYSYLKKQIYKDLLFSLFQLKIKNFKFAIRELKELIVIYKESEKSLKINRTEGFHYL